MAEASYQAQDRGDRSAYERYLAGMDASMKQKVALTAAHLLAQGEVADMGMGSGAGSHALASLYPSLQVVGVDVNPTMVELAADRYRLPNLSFLTGDVAAPCFPAGTLEGIFDSSVLHHVTTFSGYDYGKAEEALRVQVEQLDLYGSVVVRDFVAPEPGLVQLELPEETAVWLRRFAKEFRKLSGAPGFPLKELAPGRFELERRHAVEFLLRKDYRDDWDTEVLEEYTYFTQAEFEACFARLGLRVLASTPLFNPWILRHRFRGQFTWSDPEDPPTNYIIVGERVPAGEGVVIRAAEAAEPLNFLTQQAYRLRGTEELRDLVSRPHRTLDEVPFFREGEELFVLARQAYPRPILTAPATPPLDGSTPIGYVVEPLTALQGEKPLGLTVEDVLLVRAGITQILRVHGGLTYYPSPGGILEEVNSAWVEIEPLRVKKAPLRAPFSSSGQLRAMEAQQLLRAAQVGGLPDARLEINVLELMGKLGVRPDPWIGEAIELPEGPGAPPPPVLGAPRRAFEPASQGCGFLRLECRWFEELDAAGKVVGRQRLEYVMPARYSTNTLAVALLYRWGKEVYLGVCQDDLPAAQGFTGNSNLLVAPAWRLPAEVRGMNAARRWVREQLARDYGLELGECWELGGRYYPTPGLTPELVFPMAMEVRSFGQGVHWLPLQELVALGVPDAHLRILALRAALALRL